MEHRSDREDANWETSEAELIIDNDETLTEDAWRLVRDGDFNTFEDWAHNTVGEGVIEYARTNWPDQPVDTIDWERIWNNIQRDIQEHDSYEDRQLENESQKRWPDSIPWEDSEQDYYRNASITLADFYIDDEGKARYEENEELTPNNTGIAVGQTWEGGGNIYRINHIKKSHSHLHGTSYDIFYTRTHMANGLTVDTRATLYHWAVWAKSGQLKLVENVGVPIPDDEAADALWPDKLPWSEAEQDYYRNAAIKLATPGRDAPPFEDINGTLWIWDSSSKTYIKSHGSAFDHDRNHSSGGDNNLFDPAEHRFKPKNPMQEGILAARFNECNDCGTEIGPDGKCPRCTSIAEDFKTTPQQNVTYYPFTERQPKPNNLNTDESYPSRLTYKSHNGRALTGEIAGVNMNRYQFSHARDEDTWRTANKPSLDECPECGAPMMDKNQERVCYDCGHRQPIINVEARATESGLVPLAIGGEVAGEAAGAGGMLGGIGSLMKGAMSPGAIARSVGINALMDGGDKGQAENNPPFQPQDPGDPYATVASIHKSRPSGGDNDSDDIFSTEKDLGEDDHPENDGERDFQQAVSDNPEFLKDVDDEGGPLDALEVLNPMKPFKNRQHEALTSFEHAMPLVVYYADSEMSGEDNPVLKALDDLMESAFPGYKDVSDEKDDPSEEDKDDDKDDNEVFEIVEDTDDDDEDSEDEPSEKTGNIGLDYPCQVCGQTGPCPHKAAENQTMAPGAPMSAGGTGNPAGSTPTRQRAYASMESVAARKPHMCPYHKNLVDTSLALSDPAGALSAMAQHQFGSHSCQGDWQGDKSCKFKPGMITQTYWDDKAQKAQERREQIYNDTQDTTSDQSEDYGNNLDTDGINQQSTEVADTATKAPEMTPNNVTTVDFGYSPSAEGLDSAVGGGEMQMAASARAAVVESETDSTNFADSDNDGGKKVDDPLWKDDQGQPLREGGEYLLKAPSYEIPDRITVHTVNPHKITFTVHTDMMEYTDDMSRLDVENGKYEFINASTDEAKDVPDSTDGFDGTGEDSHELHGELEDHDPSNVHASLMGYDEQEFPHYANRAWLLEGTEHTARKEYTPAEQRKLIDELGKARNLSKLDLSSTHYIESSESIPEEHLFLW